jgi:hypothetical protein
MYARLMTWFVLFDILGILWVFVKCSKDMLRGKVVLQSFSRAGIFKPLWSPGIDAKASIPPAYEA